MAGGDILFEESSALDSRRKSEIVVMTRSAYNLTEDVAFFKTEVIFDHKYASKGDSLMDIILTIFIICVFTVCLYNILNTEVSAQMIYLLVLFLVWNTRVFL